MSWRHVCLEPWMPGSPPFLDLSHRYKGLCYCLLPILVLVLSQLLDIGFLCERRQTCPGSIPLRPPIILCRVTFVADSSSSRKTHRNDLLSQSRRIPAVPLVHPFPRLEFLLPLPSSPLECIQRTFADIGRSCFAIRKIPKLRRVSSTDHVANTVHDSATVVNDRRSAFRNSRNIASPGQE
jgi:hypothetical protein